MISKNDNYVYPNDLDSKNYVFAQLGLRHNFQNFLLYSPIKFVHVFYNKFCLLGALINERFRVIKKLHIADFNKLFRSDYFS